MRTSSACLAMLGAVLVVLAGGAGSGRTAGADAGERPAAKSDPPEEADEPGPARTAPAGAGAADASGSKIQTLVLQWLDEDTKQRRRAVDELAASGDDALAAARNVAETSDLTTEGGALMDVLVGTLEAARETRKAVDAYFEGKHPGTTGDVLPVIDESLHQTFPDYTFHVVRFAAGAGAPPTPGGMRPSNVFAVRHKDGAVTHLADAAGTKAFFAANLPPVTNKEVAALAARSWLRVSEEWRQDGTYQFHVPDDRITVQGGRTGMKVTGTTIAARGGADVAEIVVTMVFDKTGKLTTATDKGEQKQGARPSR